MDSYVSIRSWCRACYTYPSPADRNAPPSRLCLAFFLAVQIEDCRYLDWNYYLQVLGWSLQDFIQFYRPADCRAAMALARVRDGGGQTEEDLKRAALIAEGNRVSLVTQLLFCGCSTH